MAIKKIGLEDIEGFLSKQGYDFDIEEDNRIHVHGPHGYHMDSRSEYRLQTYCLEHFLKWHLGIHFEKLESESILICHLAGMNEDQTNIILWAYKFLKMLKEVNNY